MIFLRQSTAGQEVQLGKFVDDTDFKTAETGLTIANTDVKLWKEGATAQANKNSGGATHIANGWYYVVLDATDTNTVGNLEITVDVAGALSVRRPCVVLAAAVYDVLFGTTAPSTHTAAAVQALVAAGPVSSVTGDVGGKVLGGGSGTITGTGVRAVDSSGNAIAPASTALSTAQWTNTLATNLGTTNATVATNLNATVGSRSSHSAADVVTALGTGSTLTALATAANLATVASYLDTEIAAILEDTGTTIPAQIAALNDFDPASDTVAHVTLVDTCTANTDMRGTDNAAPAATALSTAQWSNTRAGYLDNLSGGAVALASGVTVSDKTGFALTSAYDFAKGTAAVTESYAANGAAPTPVQALLAIHQMLMGFAISGTSYTVKQLDGSTTAFVVTLNDSSNPTGAARA